MVRGRIRFATLGNAETMTLLRAILSDMGRINRNCQRTFRLPVAGFTFPVELPRFSGQFRAVVPSPEVGDSRWT